VGRITRALLLVTSTLARDFSQARTSARFVAAAEAVFFLQRIQVERREEEEALELGCLPGAESPQVARAPLPQRREAEVVCLLEELRAVETPRRLPGGLPKLHQLPSRNTIAAVGGK
jgi:hypothetical protein